VSAAAGSLALTGILIVFGVLSLIALVVGLFKRLDDSWQDRERDEEAAALERRTTVDDTTLVILCAAAAVAAGGRFRVRRIRRLLSPRQKRTPWSAQGRLILQGSHGVRAGRDRR